MQYTPPPGSQDPNAKYVTGVPGQVKGSPVPAEAVEHPQREIVNVIVEAGLEPTNDDLTQLAQAVGILAGQGASGFIAGGVAMFSGAFGGDGNRHPIPRGATEPDTSWVLCDGGSDGMGGFVPDLRGRMILGASDSHPMGETGGEETHSHSLSGTVGETTLTVEQLASHSHSLSLQVHTGSPTAWTVPACGTKAQNYTGVTSGTGQSGVHTHSLSGSSGSASALPPYYALAFIMKLA